MKKITLIIIGLCLHVAVIPVLAKSISEVLDSGDQTFDPWNQARWADWYEDGQIVKPFIIDRSVTFASRTTPWAFSLEKFVEVNGTNRALFLIQGNSPVVIDGNSVVLDARTPDYQDWTAQDWHENAFDREDINTKAYAFRFWQTGSSELPSILKNITITGFWRAAETRPEHQLPVIWENITAKGNTCAFYTTGSNGLIRNCQVLGSIAMGIYADQSSHNWTIENNEFCDNGVAGTRSWSAITLDACYAYTIRNNNFLPPSGTPKDFFIGITLYRNQGEKGVIREYAVSWHCIEQNRFQGFNIAVDVGIRMGMKPSSILTNLAQEGRCYASYNFIQENSFEDCRIGVLIRTGFNKVDGNTFENTQVPIALHNIFYSLHHNIIVNQPNEQVSLWSEVEEFQPYAKYVAFYDALGAQIDASEKFYHVISPTGSPSFTNPGKATLVVSDALVDLPAEGEESTNYNTFSLSQEKAAAAGFDNKPVDMAVGKFTESRPASDFAVIFDRPSSQVGNNKYYSIYLFDQNGREFDRCGRSEKRWSKITAGDFLSSSGKYVQEGNYEIAAVSSEPDENGSYPVYIFRKGVAEPAVVLMKDNKIPVVGLASGNFHPGKDQYDEIAVLLENTGMIRLVKPTDASWASEIQTGNTQTIAIAAGEFDGNEDNGDEIAAIVDGNAPISLFKVGGKNPYAFSGFSGEWKRIAAGGFRGNDVVGDQLAAAKSDKNGFNIHFFDAEKEDAFQTMVSPLPGSLPLRIAGGQYVSPDMDESASPQLGGLMPPADNRPVAARLAVLPTTSNASIPVLVWMRVRAENKAVKPKALRGNRVKIYKDNLTHIECKAAGITEMDLSNAGNIESILVDSNTLTELDVSTNPKLRQLSIAGNQGITDIDVANNPALTMLYIGNTSLDACALNVLYNTLPTKKGEAEFNLFIEGSTGAATSKTSIASAKGWAVDVAGDGTGCAGSSARNISENTATLLLKDGILSFSGDKTSVLLVDTTGRTILQADRVNNLNVSSLPKGLYLARYNASGMIKTAKVLKRE